MNLILKEKDGTFRSRVVWPTAPPQMSLLGAVGPALVAMGEIEELPVYEYQKAKRLNLDTWLYVRSN
jgi:hypothetical protein